MDQKTLTYVERKPMTKGAMKRLRLEGNIPAVVYGQGKAYTISVSAREFANNFKTISESTIISLKGSKDFSVLIKDFQDDIITGNLQHIDFLEIKKGSTVKTHVPVHLKGTPAGVKAGGLLETNLHEVEIECLPTDLPSEIVVDVSALEIGGSIHLSEVSVPKGVKLLNAADTVVAHIINSKKMKVDVPEAVEAVVAEGATKESK